MNIKTNLLSAVLAAGTLSVIAAESTVPDSITVEAGVMYEINVASGDTVTYSGVISGEGGVKKTGAGTLILSGANTFSGGFNLAAGMVRADNTAAFGTAAVTNSATESGSQITFNVVDGVFENDFVLNGSKSGGSTATASMYFNKSTVMNGDITLTRESNFAHPSGSGAPTVEFNGEIKGGKSIIYNIYGNAHFKSKIAVYKLYCGQYDSSTGKVHLYSPDNTISHSVILKKASLVCHADNVLGGAPLSMRSTIGGTSTTFIDLNGFDQRIKYITSEANPNPSLSATGGKIKSAEPAVLTITGMAANSTCTGYYGVDGKVSVVFDVDATSTQKFDRRTSATSGTLEVKSGTFEIMGTATFRNVPSVTVHEDGVFLMNSTEERALESLETLTVKGKFSVGESAVNPFGNNLNIDLCDNAEFSLPEGMTLFVKSFSTNGAPVMGHMRINAGDVPQFKAGTIMISTAVSENSWVGGGAGESVGLSANWKNPDNVDLTGGMRATFAASDAVGFSACIDEDVIFRHMLLSAANGFEFIGERTVCAATGIVAAAESGSTPVYSFKSPLQLGNSQFMEESHFPLSVAEGVTLRLEGGTASSVDVKKAGVGTIDISGSNVWDGAFVVSDGNVNIAGTITTSGGVDGSTSVSRGGDGVLTFNMSPDRGASANRYLTVSNAVIEKPIWFAMGESSSTSYFNFPAGTTNIFRGYFQNDDQANQRFRLRGKDTVVVFEGGGYFPWNFYQTGIGTVYFRKKPFSTGSGNADHYYCVAGGDAGTGCAVFEVGGHYMKWLTIGGDGGCIDMRVDNVLGSSSSIQMIGEWIRGQQGSVLKLNNTFQTVGRIVTGDLDDAYSWIEGDGATLYVTNNVTTRNSTCRLRFTGDVSLDFDSPGTMLITNAVSSSCGRIGVRRGTVTFAHDAAWTNASEVAVSGTGRLVVDAQDGGARSHQVFSKEATLNLTDDGVLDLADGVHVRVKELFVNGVKMPRGNYGYSRTSDESVRRHFAESTGTVSVHGEGAFTVTIR